MAAKQHPKTCAIFTQFYANLLITPHKLSSHSYTITQMVEKSIFSKNFKPVSVSNAQKTRLFSITYLLRSPFSALFCSRIEARRSEKKFISIVFVSKDGKKKKDKNFSHLFINLALIGKSFFRIAGWFCSVFCFGSLATFVSPARNSLHTKIVLLCGIQARDQVLQMAYCTGIMESYIPHTTISKMEYGQQQNYTFFSALILTFLSVNEVLQRLRSEQAEFELSYKIFVA